MPRETRIAAPVSFIRWLAARTPVVHSDRAVAERRRRDQLKPSRAGQPALVQGRAVAGVLLGSGKLATELDRLNLIDEYRFLVHPRIAGHGPTLYQSGLPSTRRLELVSATPLRNGAVAMHYRRARG